MTEPNKLTLHCFHCHSIPFAGHSDSFRLTRKVEHALVAILIDYRSSHNFMHPQVIKKLHWPMTQKPHFKVQMGYGDTISSQGRVQGLSLII